ncbi:SET domain-containing protein-lysine N-methyltransferase [Candidatus Gracilibacteria bacterium CG17_big_fil_post_rev_8_21_14_2_50_48_13]|nr:MAG: SET domain-containing protein-lysine N-methyltransferase [Candidatus Gracilibacteria bacterium CG17_big_fil_post_rev_8_21_14_2_50_48_13]
MQTFPTPEVYVAQSAIHGRGVFAARDFTPGEIIEYAHAVRVPASEQPFLDQTVLYNYYFTWNGDNAIVLGNGSIYNHSYAPNARYDKEFATNTLIIVCIAPIRAHEEITVNYNGDPANTSPVWFDKGNA